MLADFLYIILALLMLGFITMAHEFGHYIAARITGIGVLEFSVGVGPKLVSWNRNEIKYTVRILPFGGFCRFASAEDGQVERPDVFEKQKVWKRFVTILSGPAMNFVLAFVFVWIILALVGLQVVETVPVIDELSDNMPAQEAGLLPGDTIIEVNGKGISEDLNGVYTLRDIISKESEHPLDFVIRRGEETLDVSVLPEMTLDGDMMRPMIGIVFGTKQTGIYRYSVTSAIPEAWGYLTRFSKTMLEFLRNLIFRGEGLNEVSGPVGIISVMSAQVREGWGMVCNLIFVLSLNLGFMNLLPIPGLDGGRLVFLLVEAVRRKPIPPEKESLVHALGLLALIIVAVLVTYKDIVALFAR